MNSILDFIRSSEIKLNPHSTAVILPDRKITYAELNDLIKRTLAFLKETGIKKNDIITLLFNNSIELVVLTLSLWEIGAIPVPLNTKLLQKELKDQVDFLKSKFTIKQRTVDFSFDSAISFSLKDLKETEEKIFFDNPSLDETALILFTSGSSEKPKAVKLSFDNLIQSSLTGNKVLNQTSDDRWLASLPFYHIGGFSIIVRALMFGTSVVIPVSLSNQDLIDSIKKYKPTLTSLVSNQLKYFVDKDFIPPKELRTVLLGGGFFDTQLILKAINKKWNVAKVYGSTETSSFISFMNTEELKTKPGASGKVIPPNKIKITEDGEITIKGHSVMKGYFDNELENLDSFIDGYFYTGDLGYFDEEGYLFVEAKRNDLIISGGENINPLEIEKVILSNPNVKEVCIVGKEDEQWGQILSAAIVLDQSANFTENDLTSFLREKLPSFKIPKKILFACSGCMDNNNRLCSIIFSKAPD